MSPYIASALIGLAVGAGGMWRVEEWRADAAKLAAAREGARITATQATVTEKVDTASAQKIAKQQVITKTIIKEVVKYVPLDSPPVPGGFRVLHDAAARGVLPDPASKSDAASVPLADVAGTVVDNYASCREDALRFESLQQWVREQRAVK